MCPYLFEVAGFQVGTYGLFMALGFLVCGVLLARELKRRGHNPEIAWEIVLTAAITGVIGARIVAVLEDPAFFYADPWGALLTRGGLTWYGGLLFATPACLLLFRWRRLPLVDVMDAAAPLLFLGYAFGRGGCQVSGDGCYGQATDLPWGMTYANGLVPAPYPVHPTPLYEILYSLAGFAVLWFWLRFRPLPRGTLFAIFLVTSAVARFLVEFIRINPRYWFSWEGGLHLVVRYPEIHGHAGLVGLSLSQWLSIALFLWGALWLGRLYIRPRTGKP